MDLNDTAQEEQFRSQIRTWLADNLPQGWETLAHGEREVRIETSARDELSELRADAPAVVRRIFPEVDRLYAARGDTTVTQVNALHCLHAIREHGGQARMVQLGPVSHEISDFLALPRIVRWFQSLH